MARAVAKMISAISICGTSERFKLLLVDADPPSISYGLGGA